MCGITRRNMSLARPGAIQTCGSAQCTKHANVESTCEWLLRLENHNDIDALLWTRSDIPCNSDAYTHTVTICYAEYR
jgi:hypothetical protein